MFSFLFFFLITFNNRIIFYATKNGFQNQKILNANAHKKKIMIIIYNIYIYIVIIVIGNKIFTGVAFLVPKSRFTKMYIDV